MLTASDCRILVYADLGLAVMIGLHDLDHLRQARNWCYTIPLSVWIVNISVFLPGFVALLLAMRRHRYAPLVTVTAGLMTATSFAKVHLTKPLFPIWGIWNTSYIALGVDAIAWWVLALTVFVSVVVALIGAFVLGQR